MVTKIQVLSYLKVMQHGKIIFWEIWGLWAFLEEKKNLYVLLSHCNIICSLESAFGSHIFLDGNPTERQLRSFCLALPDFFDFP